MFGGRRSGPEVFEVENFIRAAFAVRARMDRRPRAGVAFQDTRSIGGKFQTIP
jgi:hypothetical protein